MTTYQKNLTQLLPGQIPEYVQSYYPLFVIFVTQYYKYLQSSSSGAQYSIQNIQLNSDIDTTATVPATAAFIRVTNSNTGVIPNMFSVPAPAVGGAFRAVVGSATCTHTMPVRSANGTTYYVMVSTVA